MAMGQTDQTVAQTKFFSCQNGELPSACVLLLLQDLFYGSLDFVRDYQSEPVLER